jgi:hypothetical protein
VDDVGNHVFHTRASLQQQGLPVHFSTFAANDTGYVEPELLESGLYV